MFVTHEPFKFPVQFQGDGGIWTVVELMLQTPWLILTADDDQEDTTRTFFLNGTDALLQFLQNPTLGKTTGVHLVFPPRWYPSNDKDWSLVRVRRVEREIRSIDGAVPGAVLTSVEGKRYGGFPIEAIDRADADLELVVELQPTADG
jgi:hypothetical protein